MAEQKSESLLSGRAQLLFRSLVERYIKEGRPVGSRTLSRDSALDLSPATIRNVMADLEDLGLLSAPHTSAGRVPTVRGYRLFVDTMLKIEPIGNDEFRRLHDQLLPSESREDLMGTVSSLLSEVTQMAGLITLPRQEHLTLRQVEFLPLSERQVLVIMVVNEREVQNRIIQTQRGYSSAELQQAGNYLTELCGGQPMAGCRERILEELREHRENLNSMMLAAIDMANTAFSESPAQSDELLVTGQTNLMGYGELSDMEKLRHLFEAFSRKQDILHLLDQSLQASGVQIFIGEESGYEVFDDVSLVTAPYDVDGDTVGVLGVIGPTRMAYDRGIPIVDVTARLVGAALNKSH